VLHSVLKDDHVTVSELNTFSDIHREQVWDWNSKYPETVNSCIHDLIGEQVVTRPLAQAICAWDGNFTYEEMGDLSTRLSYHLMASGLRSGAIVPLCFEKSAWAIITMMAVLKAGSAFVPLDPSYPPNRLKSIIQQLSPDILLSMSPHAHENCALEVEKMVIISSALVRGLPRRKDQPRVKVTPEDVMYVLFTSGSTGQPKGVVMEHSAASSSIMSHGKAMNFGSASRALQFAPYGFDASIAEIFTTLVYGGCICVPSETERLESIVSVINKMEVNWAFFTPSFIPMIKPDDVPTLKTLVLGGEAMRKENVETWAGKVQLINGYGPTETCVFSLIQEVMSTDCRPQTVGLAVGSTSWVVDASDHERLMPVGCVGELLIGGPQLARGYLNDQEKTSEVFIEDPIWADESDRHQRMYKTGDLVRYNSDGTLDYLGRKDTQVKLHGQRLELGEVEQHLESDGDVRNVIVMVPTQGQSQKRLVAIAALKDFGPPHSALDSTSQPRGGGDYDLEFVDENRKELADLQVSRVRQQLSGQLPSYMVPTVWLIVKSIPLNAAGKLDRAKVARWVQEMDKDTYLRTATPKEDDEGLGKGPTTAMDRRLQEVLGRVLNLPVGRIILSRSFLSLGGDSITAMQAVSRARAEGITIRVQDLLRSKSISELALVAKTSTQSSLSHADDIGTVFDLSPIQQMYFQMMGQQRVNQFNQSFFLRLTRETRAQSVAQAVEAVVRQHSMLRARFQRGDNGRWGQLITKDTAESYRFRFHEVTDRGEMAKIMAASQAGLEIESGPVMIADMFNIEGDGQLLFLVAHHLVVDLVSWRVVLQDLEDILESGSLSSGPPFPFQAWCKLQVEYAQQLVPSKVLLFDVAPANYAYWSMTDQPNLYGDTLNQSFIIDEGTTSILLGSCQKALGTEPVELFMASLLHAFGQTFHDRMSPTVFSEGHGREPWDAEVDLSGTVGWFTTMSPLHVPITSGTSIVEAVRRTKDTKRSISANGWPYFASRFLNPEGIKKFSNDLPMEVLFNYLGRYQQLERKDALLVQETVPSGVSDVDLQVPRLALFEVSVAVIHGFTQFNILYNKHMQRQDGVIDWMHAWKRSLQEAARHLSHMEAERTLSDFPLLPLTYGGLETLMTERLKDIGVSSFEGVEDVYPCSPMQQGLLLSQTKSSGSYEVGFTYEVLPSAMGPLVDAKRLLSAWQQVVDRHASLRTVFVDSVCEEGLFDQIVLNHVITRTATKPCETVDAALIACKEYHEIDHREARPPHQFTIYQTTAGTVFFKLEINHAVIDAASMVLVLRDLALAYNRNLSLGPGPLYSNYIGYLKDRPLRLAMNYWKEYLAGLEPCHFPVISDADGAKELRHLGVDLDLPPKSLSSFCEKHGVTVPNLVQTVWGLVLRCYTGSDQVCFGYLVSGRDVAVEGIEEVVGPFINMLICRMEVTRINAPQLVEQIQAGYLAGLEYQHCSLAQMQHGLNLAGRPLFNTIVSVQRASSTSATGVDIVESDGISFRNVDAYDPTEVSY
jgi:amino acid adenylation domain-containing protein/non-ribosomal peptide synthase protein (TIGR01720 family)